MWYGFHALLVSFFSLSPLPFLSVRLTHFPSGSLFLSLSVIDLLVLWTLIFPASCPVDLVHAIKLLRGQVESFVI